MNRDKYMQNLYEAWRTGKISETAYDAAIINMSNFVDEEE